jgi:hypothetical protein
VSVATLLTEPVTIYRSTAGAEDDYGNVTHTWAVVRSTVGFFQQRDAVELTRDRDTQVSDWLLFLAADEVVSGRDRVGDQYGRVFEVVGTPNRPISPAHGPSHVEVSLRHVDGG